MHRPNLLLTKSKYILGLKCDRWLWYLCHQPELLRGVKEDTDILFEQGKEVGELAKKLFPGGKEIRWEKGFREGLDASQLAIKQRKAVFEAGFRYQDLFAKADVLTPLPKNQWELTEVKSSTKIREEHLIDVAFQKYIYEKCGIKITRCRLMYINHDYNRKGTLKPNELFLNEDITERVSEYLPDIQQQVRKMRRILMEKQCPQLRKCDHCNSPKSCPIPDICWSFLPDRHIFFLYGDSGKRRTYELWSRGILNLKDIPHQFPLSDKQRIQWVVEISGEPYLLKKPLETFLRSLKFPLYFFDFETYGTAIPQINHAQPYENIPFQYSLHAVPNLNKKAKHYGFLSTGKKDPRPRIMERLQKELGTHGSIIVYSAIFEKQILEQCAERYPKYKNWVKKILPRIVDLRKPFSAFHFYHPKQNGSASLKSVMPVLTERSYQDLEIREGGRASAEYLRVTFGDVKVEERNRIRKHLEIYCKQDTEGMIDIIRALGIQIQFKFNLKNK